MTKLSVDSILEDLYKIGYNDGQSFRVPACKQLPYVFTQAKLQLLEVIVESLPEKKDDYYPYQGYNQAIQDCIDKVREVMK